MQVTCYILKQGNNFLVVATLCLITFLLLFCPAMLDILSEKSERDMINSIYLYQYLKITDWDN